MSGPIIIRVFILCSPYLFDLFHSLNSAYHVNEIGVFVLRMLSESALRRIILENIDNYYKCMSLDGWIYDFGGSVFRI